MSEEEIIEIIQSERCDQYFDGECDGPDGCHRCLRAIARALLKAEARDGGET